MTDIYCTNCKSAAHIEKWCPYKTTEMRDGSYNPVPEPLQRRWYKVEYKAYGTPAEVSRINPELLNVDELRIKVHRSDRLSESELKDRGLINDE